MNLRKIQMQIAPKGKKKSKKIKSKKAKKSKKDKKKKPLPGEKIAELKGLDSDQMLSILIEHQLVVRGRERKLDSFIGDFNYLGSMHHNADRKDGNDECHTFFSFISRFFTLFPTFSYEFIFFRHISNIFQSCTYCSLSLLHYFSLCIYLYLCLYLSSRTISLYLSISHSLSLSLSIYLSIYLYRSLSHHMFLSLILSFSLSLSLSLSLTLSLSISLSHILLQLLLFSLPHSVLLSFDPSPSLFNFHLSPSFSL